MSLIIGISLVLATIAAVGLLAGNEGGSGPGVPIPRSVVAGFYPLAFAAERVGGPGLEVENLTPPGVEPHDLEASRSDIQGLRSADRVLLMGEGFQPELERAVEGDDGVVLLLDTPGLDATPGDPHVWLDPLRFATIVEQIGAELHDPGAARRLDTRLRALDADFRRGLADCGRDEIVTSHDAFGYMADRYGLEQVAVTGISPEAEAAPGDLQQVVDTVRSSGATTIFTEPLVSRSLADTVARETGTSVETLNPIEGLTRAQAADGEDYFTLMRENLSALRRALGCR